MNREQRRAAEKESRRKHKKSKRVADSILEVAKQLAYKRMLDRLKEMKEENGTTTETD